jgi:class 3 adenylate cyclase
VQNGHAVRMTGVPETRYARSGETYIAYQTLGDGPVDLVWMPMWASQLEMMWEDPSLPAFFDRLAGFCRVLLFDRRGVGLSDPLPLGVGPGIEAWVDDVAAVMDAVGSTRAFIGASDVASFIAILFAAAQPDRTTGLLLVNGSACVRRHRDYPAGLPPPLVDALVRATESGWGGRDPSAMPTQNPSMASSEAWEAWTSRYQRATASPGTMAAMTRMLVDTDVRHVLPNIRVPTVVVHRVDDSYIRVDHGRYLAANIPDARYVELPGRDHSPNVGDASSVLGVMEEFITGEPPVIGAERVLRTVVFTDIVDSTGRASALGDQDWILLLNRHFELVERHVGRFGGRVVKSTGDGVLAVFDGPARAVRCACVLRDALRSIELPVRAGVHTGEVEVNGDDLAGIAVHVASRISSLAQANEVLASRTVKDLVAGSGIDFDDRGHFALKGIDDEWQIFTVTGT